MVEKFPAQATNYGAMLFIRLTNNMGSDAKAYLREMAKKHFPEMFSQPIKTEFSGHTKDGEEIPIDSVGLWLFGAPGYPGNIRVSNKKGAEAKVEFPPKSPRTVYLLLFELKQIIEIEPW